MSKDGRIWLSHTGIENLERCPRCFWLQYRKGIYQPEGIVSRLANRFDIVMKNYFNSFRGTGELPPMVTGKLDGRLQNPFQEKYFVRVNDKFGFLGKLDECLVNEKGELIPVDFKTSSSDPREKEVLSAYRSQIDDYVYCISKNGNKVAGYGYLVFVYPDESQHLHIGFPMIIHIQKLDGDPVRTETRIERAISYLEKDIPAPSESCKFCAWYEILKKELSNNLIEKGNPTQSTLDLF